MKAYPVYETFLAAQGEGDHMGRSALFIRLYGCDQACPWCDSAGTWHPQWRPDHVVLRRADDLAAEVVARAPRGTFVVVTGGEPALFDLAPLVDALHAADVAVHLETAGHRPIRGAFDWITLSPKPLGKLPLQASIDRAHEFKIIVDSLQAIEAGLDALHHPDDGRSIWLHPEWSRRGDADILGAIAEAATMRPALRFGYQLHKLYKVDERDASSVSRPIPLGGDPARGPAT